MNLTSGQRKALAALSKKYDYVSMTERQSVAKVLEHGVSKYFELRNDGQYAEMKIDGSNL